MGYVHFEDYFEYKHCPSIPGPQTDYSTYMGITTADSRLLLSLHYRAENGTELTFQTYFNSRKILRKLVIMKKK